MPIKTSLGFTGTRNGMSKQQKLQFRHFARKFYGEFHYGVCVGADEEAAQIIDEIGGYRINSHPPNNPQYLSNFVPKNSKHVIFPSASYSDRDLEVVLASKYMIATPKGWKEEKRGSGTWLTIRMARAETKPIAIIYPDGEIKYERWKVGR